MPVRRIVTSVGMSYGWGRAVMRGVAEHLRSRPGSGWLVFAEPVRLEPDRLAGRLDGIDGVIIDTPDPRVIGRLARRRVPFVNLDTRMYDLGTSAPSVGADEHAVGAAPPHHLLDLGLRSLAYCGVHGHGPRDRRRGGFLSRGAERLGPAAKASAIPLLEYRYPPTHVRRDDRHRLAAWLKGLPKPVGVMAFNDLIARHVAEGCLLAGLGVPHEVAIVGVDNDDVACGLANPPLSSVDPNAERQGRLAAELLDRWLSGDPPGRVRHVLPPAGVVVRRSTAVEAVPDPVVARAVAFIADRYADRIGVDEVAAHAGVSRRKLEYRFAAVLGTGPYEEIRRHRLRAARDLLAGTRLAVADVAARCGFATAGHFIESFRRADPDGSTPAEYRRRLSGPGPSAAARVPRSAGAGG
jgi:LacI family transcriptional regulator